MELEVVVVVGDELGFQLVPLVQALAFHKLHRHHDQYPDFAHAFHHGCYHGLVYLHQSYHMHFAPQYEHAPP